MRRILLLSLCLSSFALNAAIVTVTSTAGTRGGPNCTLRDAITATETDAVSGGCPAGSGADVIQLPSAATIVLSVRETTGAAESDGLALPIVGFDLTIEGNGTVIERYAALGCDSNDNGDQPERFGLLKVDAATQSANVVALRNLTLRNACRMTGAQGSGLEVSGSVVMLDNVTFANNHAWGGGGLRFTPNGDATARIDIIDSVFEDNVARVYGGGAIATTGSFTVNGSRFDRNATDSIGSQGGAVYIGFADPSTDIGTVTDSTFSYNNAAPAGFGQGGAVFMALNGGALNLFRDTFSENNAASGGAVLLAGGINVIRDNSFLGNHAVAGSGGAIAISKKSADTTIRRSLFDSNTSTSWGGALLNYGITHIFNSTFSNNAANIFGTVNGGGGAIANEANDGVGSGVLDASFVSFIHNTALLGTEDGGTLTNASFSGGASMTLANVFIAASGTHTQQTIGTQCLFNEAPTLVGFNFANDGSCTGFTGNTSVSLADSLPTDHGGSTGTYALAAGSVAIDGGNCSNANGSTNTTDQRQITRPFDGDANGIARCDVGAFEYTTNPHLGITVTGTGSGRVTGAGIDCGGLDGDCDEYPAYGSSIVLTATPDQGSAVALWAGCNGVSSDFSTCTINSLTADTTVTVSFGIAAQPSNADVDAALTGFPSAAVNGAAITGTLTCTNHGAHAALNVQCVLTGLPPAATTTCTPATPVASLAVDAAIVCTTNFTMPNANLPLAGTATTSSPDPDSGNNADATVILRTNPNADMRVQWAQVPATTLPGEPVQLMARCGNVGPATALNVTCDVSNLPPGGSVHCDQPLPIAAMAPQDHVQCLVVYPAPASGIQTLFLSATATSPDPNTANNNISAQTRVLDADMETSGLPMLPSAALEGDLVTGTLLCRNTGPDTAVTATCELSGLPAGATFSCTPATPANLAMNAQFVCTVTFTMPATAVTLTLSATSRNYDGDASDNMQMHSITAVQSAIFGNGFE